MLLTMEGWNSLQNKAFLVCLLFLATFATSCSAFCLTTMIKESSRNIYPACRDPYGIIYPMGSKWKTGNCLDCSCNTNGVTCCTTFAVPVDYNKNKCHAIFHKEKCSYDVVEHKDPRKKCTVYFWRQ